MKILFKNKTKYTKNAYYTYIQFHKNKYGHQYTFNTIVTILLLSFCLIINLQYSNFLTAFLIIISLISFIIYIFFYQAKKVEKELKTEKFIKETEFTFTFYENYFTVTDGKTIEKMRYWKLYKIFENTSFFYLYINKNYAFLLDKSTFSIGKNSNFKRFINKKIWFKI